MLRYADYAQRSPQQSTFPCLSDLLHWREISFGMIWGRAHRSSKLPMAALPIRKLASSAAAPMGAMKRKASKRKIAQQKRRTARRTPILFPIVFRPVIAWDSFNPDVRHPCLTRPRGLPAWRSERLCIFNSASRMLVCQDRLEVLSFLSGRCDRVDRFALSAQ